MTLDTEPATARVSDRPAGGRRVLIRRVVRVGWFVLLVMALWLALRSRWAEVGDQLATLDAWKLALSTVLGLVGVGISSGIWHAMLLGIGERLPLPVSLRVFFVGQIGKYLPGAVWPVVTQAALARAHGVAPRATVTAATLFLWIHLITGAIVGIVALTATGALPLAVLAALPPLLALLTPGILRWTLQRLLRLARREPLRQLPDLRHLMAACGWAVLMWLCYGAHLQVLTVAVAEPIGLLRATGVFAAGWVAGFVLLVAPAGVGPREAAIVALLPVTAAAGLLVVLVSRLALTAADAAWAGVASIDVARLRRARPPAPPVGR